MERNFLNLQKHTIGKSITTKGLDFCRQIHRKWLNDKYQKILNSLSKKKTNIIYLDKYDDNTQRNITEQIGRAFAQYFNNTTIMSTGEEDINESFYIGNEPPECGFIVINVWRKGLSVEKLGSAGNYVPIHKFIDEFCNPEFRLILERILFEHC